MTGVSRREEECITLGRPVGVEISDGLACQQRDTLIFSRAAARSSLAVVPPPETPASELVV